MHKRLQLAFITTAVALGFIYFVVPDCLAHRAVCLGLTGEQSTAPFVYRILPTAVIGAFAPATPLDTLWTATLVQMACVGVIMPLLYRWFNQSIEGVYIFGMVWIMAQHYWFVSVGTTLEILFVVLALTLINRTWLWFIPLVALAALNRETGVLVVGIYAAYHGRKQWRETVVLLAIWAGITSLLHVAIGSYPHQLGLLGTLEYNLSTLPDALLANLLLLPLAIAAYMGYKRTTTRLQRFCWVAGVYIAAVVVGGAWNESLRLLLPILPLVLPLMIETKAAQGGETTRLFA